MTIGWTKEKINELAHQEVATLQHNAIARNNIEIANWCDEVLATKRPIRKPRTSSTTKALEAECSHLLSEFAKSLNAKYDLSAATASKNSEGIKGFRPHSLTSKNGQAKLGGDQRTGKVALDRYISYRVRNEIISLTAWLASKEDVEDLKWQVRGPVHYFTNTNVAAASSNPIVGDASGLEEFTEFNEASLRFEDVIEKLLGT